MRHPLRWFSFKCTCTGAVRSNRQLRNTLRCMNSRSSLALKGKSARIPLRSTDRLPGASGSARLERKGGTTEIEVELDSMKPASLFGGDYNTYVLWVVPPAGAGGESRGNRVGRRSRRGVKRRHPRRSLRILVTAEPHYLVRDPSAFVVFANRPAATAEPSNSPSLKASTLHSFNA